METCLGYALKLYVKVRCTVREYIYSPAHWWNLKIILKQEMLQYVTNAPEGPL